MWPTACKICSHVLIGTLAKSGRFFECLGALYLTFTLWWLHWEPIRAQHLAQGYFGTQTGTLEGSNHQPSKWYRTWACSTSCMKKKPDRSVFVHKLWLKTKVKSAKVKRGLDDTQTSVSVLNVGRVDAILLQMFCSLWKARTAVCFWTLAWLIGCDLLVGVVGLASIQTASCVHVLYLTNEASYPKSYRINSIINESKKPRTSGLSLFLHVQQQGWDHLASPSVQLMFE